MKGKLRKTFPTLQNANRSEMDQICQAKITLAEIRAPRQFQDDRLYKWRYFYRWARKLFSRQGSSPAWNFFDTEVLQHWSFWWKSSLPWKFCDKFSETKVFCGMKIPRNGSSLTGKFSYMEVLNENSPTRKLWHKNSAIGKFLHGSSHTRKFSDKEVLFTQIRKFSSVEVLWWYMSRNVNLFNLILGQLDPRSNQNVDEVIQCLRKRTWMNGYKGQGKWWRTCVKAEESKEGEEHLAAATDTQSSK